MSEQIVFTDEQQAHVDKLIGEARVKARSKAEADVTAAQEKITQDAAQAQLVADKNWEKLVAVNQARITELEPLEAEAQAYRNIIDEMLKDRIKVLGDAAKAAVGALPEGLSTAAKLTWLNANEALFKTEDRPLGTLPKGKKLKDLSDKGREAHRRSKI